MGYEFKLIAMRKKPNILEKFRRVFVTNKWEKCGTKKNTILNKKYALEGIKNPLNKYLK